MRQPQLLIGLLGFTSFLAVPACDDSFHSDPGGPPANALTAPAAAGEPAAAPASSASAADLVRDVRARFGAAVEGRLAGAGVTDRLDHPLFPASSGRLVAAANGGWVPRTRASSSTSLSVSASASASASGATAAVDLVLPERAGGRLSLRDRRSALGVEVRMARGAGAAAEEADGYLVYKGGLGAGTTAFLRAADDGFEDYVLYDAPPAETEVEYAFTLIGGVAGLRLVAGTLELLDPTGTPHLRVAPPFVIGADGVRTEAELMVRHCAVDRDPAPPWGRPVVPPGARDCLLAVTWPKTGVAYPALLDPSWSTTANMATRRAHHTATTLSNGRILVTGGLTTGGGVTSSAEIFNPTSSPPSWSATASMATARYLHTATTVSTNEVVVAGGYTQLGANPTANAQRYSPPAGTWASAGTTGTARAGHAATRLADGRILVSGGVNSSGGGLTSAWRYSTTSFSWTQVASLPAARAFHTSTLLSDGTLVVAGGRSSTTGGAVAAASRYTVSSNTWAGAGTMAVPRYNHTAELMVVGGVDKVWLAGGRDGGGTITPTTEVYTRGTTGTWARSANLTYPRRHHTATTVNAGSGVGNRILVTGGIDASGAAVAVPEIFNPAWETLAETPPLGSARAYQAAAAYSSNTRVLVTGGSAASSPGTGSTYLQSSEIFDATTPAVHVSEYKEAGVMIPEVRNDIPVDLWARYYRPATLPGGARYPLVVFLHGNHDSCGRGSNPRIDDDSTYSIEGTCPTNYTVVPSHAGYEYIATELASRGYFVVSINANRGIAGVDGSDSDPSLMLARANLVLIHLEKLSRWHRGLETTPAALGVSYQGRLDLDQIGLMGHSRGGEAVRYAVTLYRRFNNPIVWDDRIGPVRFRAIFEIAPSDGFTQEGSLSQGDEHNVYLLAQNLKWAVVLPMCDGDLKNLLGIRPFDRMLNFEEFDAPSMKASYTVWGANHNYFNTEWQQSDSTGCVGTNNRPLFSTGTGISGSAEQRQAGFHAMLRFFTANVGAAAVPQQAQVFIPGNWAPPEPRVERGFTWSTYNAYNLPLENFAGPTGSSSTGIPFQTSGVAAITQLSLPEREYTSGINPPSSIPKGGHVTWSSGGSNTSLQINWTATGSGRDLSGWSNLVLRVDRARDTGRNTDASTRFNVQLVGSSGTLSAAQSVNPAVTLAGPVGSNDEAFPIYHSMLQTVVLPMSGFTGVNLSSVRGVRLLFNQSTSGAIYVADIAAQIPLPWSEWGNGGVGPAFAGGAGSPSRSAAAAPPAVAAIPAPTTAQKGPTMSPTVTAGNVVSAIRSAGAQGDVVEIDLTTATPFRVRNAPLRMAVGDVTTIRKRVTSTDGRRVTFRLRRAEFDRMPDGKPIYVFYDDGSSPPVWDFGPLRKSALR